MLYGVSPSTSRRQIAAPCSCAGDGRDQVRCQVMSWAVIESGSAWPRPRTRSTLTW